MIPSRDSLITALIQSKLSIRRVYRNWRRKSAVASSTTQTGVATSNKNGALDGMLRHRTSSDDDDFRSRPRGAAELPAYSPDPHVLPLPLLLSLLYALSLIIRTWRISYPPSIVFDEVHFLKFIRGYYYGHYFFDIHPPLGKLVLLAITYLFCGPPERKFAFNGASYENQKYVPLRLTSAVFGSAVPPLTYLIARELGLSSWASLFAAVTQAFEHMAVIESRFVLLDAQLMMWMATCLLLALRMWGKPVHKRWRLVVATALSGAAALSVKWTSLTTPALIAIVSLIGIPFTSNRLAWDEIAIAGSVATTLYTILFWVHFKMLPRSGDGDVFMRENFQATLLDSKFYREGYKGPGFWTNYYYLNVEMYLANKGITARHKWESKWWQWIINQRGLIFFSEVTSTEETFNWEKVYVIVNPALTLITCVALITFFVMAIVWNIRRWRRKIPSKKSNERRRMHACMSRGAFLFAGYIFNILPYIGMFHYPLELGCRGNNWDID